MTKLAPLPVAGKEEGNAGAVRSSQRQLIGQRVGNYVIERPLARGGMGAVFVARHPHLGREVAVKFLDTEISARPEFAERFLSEAQVTARLHHPNIVDILDFGEVDGRLYYVMELLRGQSLGSFLHERPRPTLDEALSIIGQILRALEAAHGAGVVHRDLKPDNVIVLEGAPLRLKLVDFGVAKLMSTKEGHTQSGQVLGTPGHMAPEQAMGNIHLITPQTDLYALGVMAFELLTGRPPFEAESDFMLMIMHVRDPAPGLRQFEPSIPEAVAAVLEPCLAKAPQGRPVSAQALREALEQARAGLEAAVAGGRAPAPPSPVRREHAPLGLGSAPTQASAEPALGGAGTVAQASIEVVWSEAEKPRKGPGVVWSEAEGPRTEPVVEAFSAAVTISHHEAGRGRQAAEGVERSTARTLQTPELQGALEGRKAPEVQIVDRAVGQGAKQDAQPGELWVDIAPSVSPAVNTQRSEAVAAPEPLLPAAPSILRTSPPSETAESTLNKLTQRLQRKGDFPAFAQSIGEVSVKADANSAYTAGQLGDVILKDYALTAKLLRIINSMYSSRLGVRIYSIKHAIVLLGFDRIRSLALGISLFKSSGKGEVSRLVSESAIGSLVSGELARSLAARARVNDEEAMVCAMFRNLGRHLVIVYLPELFEEIQHVTVEAKVSERKACERVLGITFSQIGAAIARNWNLPPGVQDSVSGRSSVEGPLQSPEDKVNALAELSNDLCEVIAGEDPALREQQLGELLGRYRKLLVLDEQAVVKLVTEVEETFQERYSAVLGLNARASRFLRNAAAIGAAAGEQPGPGGALQAHAAMGAVGVPLVGGQSRAQPQGAVTAAAERARPVVQKLELGRQTAAVGGRAIPFEARVEGLRAGDATGEELLTQTLALFCEHVAVGKVLLLAATAARDELFVRAGLHPNLEGLSKELRLALKARGQSNVFQTAYASLKDVEVRDAYSKASAVIVPQRYYETIGAPAFALYACGGKGRPHVLLLVEGDTAEALPNPERVAELGSLRLLIAQAAAGK